MDTRIKEALLASIEHWRELTLAESVSDTAIGPSECALCTLFYNDDYGRSYNCEGCPVAVVTGMPYCVGSPYEQSRTARNRWMDNKSSTELRDEFREAAKAELAFLESLLPKDSDNAAP